MKTKKFVPFMERLSPDQRKRFKKGMRVLKKHFQDELKDKDATEKHRLGCVKGAKQAVKDLNLRDKESIVDFMMYVGGGYISSRRAATEIMGKIASQEEDKDLRARMTGGY
jgi:hypothetical protein